MKITGAVRVIKGQEVLPDGNILEEHGILDGSTVNIVIEPDKKISIQVKIGPLQFIERVKNSVVVHHLKRQLIDGHIVGFKFKDFSLLVSCVDNDGIPADIPLQDESLPLHLHGVGDNTTLRVIGGRVAIKLVNQKGKGWYKTFSKNVTVAQMKQTILSTDSLFSVDEDKNLLKDVWLFVECGDFYRELDDEAKIVSRRSSDSLSGACTQSRALM